MFPIDRILRCIPRKGLIRSYFNYACARYPGIPIIYHVAAAYSLVSALCPTDSRISLPADDRPTSLWVLMVGDSGTGKSTAYGLAESILSEALAMGDTGKRIPDMVSGVSGTAEGLYTLAKDSRRPDDLHEGDGRYVSILRLWEDDMGKTLAASRNAHGPSATLRAALLSFYDGRPRREVLASKTYLIPRNRTSIFLGATPAQLVKDTSSLEWETGFFSRFLMLYNTDRMTFEDPVVSDHQIAEQRTSVLRMANVIANRVRVQDQSTVWTLGSRHQRDNIFATPSAEKYYHQASARFHEMEMEAGRFAKGPIQRSTDMAVRAAVTLMLSGAGVPDGYSLFDHPQTWRLTEETLKCGFYLAWLHTQSALFLSKSVTADSFGRLCADIIECLQDGNGMAKSLQEIHVWLADRAGRVPTKTVMVALESLRVEGRVYSSDEAEVATIQSGTGTQYALDPMAFLNVGG